MEFANVLQKLKPANYYPLHSILQSTIGAASATWINLANALHHSSDPKYHPDIDAQLLPHLENVSKGQWIKLLDLSDSSNSNNNLLLLLAKTRFEDDIDQLLNDLHQMEPGSKSTFITCCAFNLVCISQVVMSYKASTPSALFMR